jgi:hypothetical protein
MITDRRKEIVDAAISYAQKGWQVYPIQPPKGSGCSCRKGDRCPDPGKHPHHDLGGLKAATIDRDQLRTIFAAEETNVGLLCDKSFWVLDVDGPEGLRDLDELIELHGEIPRTPSVETGGGGRHYLFAFDPRVRKRGRIDGKSIETIAGNQAIVAAPSLHVSGSCYRWMISPDEANLAIAPAWLLDFVIPKKKTATKGQDAQTKFSFEDDDLRTAPGVVKGDRNATLCRLVGSHLAREGATPDLLALSIAWGGRCDPPLREEQVSKPVAYLVAKHLANNEDNPQDEDEDEDLEETSEEGELQAIPFSEIKAKPVAWLWSGRLALGKITLLSGDGGVGKTTVLCDVASRISVGRLFPDGSPCPLGDAYFIGAEDGAEDTLRPRIDAAGGNPARIHLLRGPIPKGSKIASPIDLSRHLTQLDKLLERNPEAKLLIIDPILDYLGDRCNSDKATDVRRVLGPLRELAERRQVSVIALNHLRKSKDGGSKSRSLGSGAFVQVARFEFRVIEDPSDPDRRLFGSVKNNLAKAPTLAFKIEGTSDGAGFAVWEDKPVEIEIAEAEADQGDENRSDLDQAVEWIRSFLSEGEVRASEAELQARKDGIKERTLRRARKRLGVVCYQKNRAWWWRLGGSEEGDAGSEDNPQESEAESIETNFVF